MLFLTLIYLTISLILFYYLINTYFSRNYSHWKQKNIPFETPKKFFGNIFPVFSSQYSIGEAFQKIHLKNPLKPFTGLFIFDEPVLLIRDPDLIKSVLVKDFSHFIDRTIFDNPRDDPMGTHVLFVLKNPAWKEIRRKITPVFTSGKMRLMYKLIEDCGKDLIEYLRNQKEVVIESRELCAKYTTEAITSTAFGIKANCFKDEQAGFRIVSRRIFNWNILSRGIACTCFFISPFLVKLFRMQFIDGFSADYLRKTFWQVMEEREKNKFTRNDLLDILIQMRKDEQLDDPFKLEGDKLVAQATQFFMAGYETSSSTITFALYELARNQEVQTCLRQELSKPNIKFDYETIKDLPYLDMVISETLRKYPILPFLDRRCTKEYTIPNTNTILEKGTGVFISVIGLHYDPQNYPEPENFIPERFTEANKKARNNFTYLPFGEGPRNCIGARFGLLSSKCGLAHIIKNFRVETCLETPEKMKFHPRGFLLAPENGLKFKFCPV